MPSCAECAVLPGIGHYAGSRLRLASCEIRAPDRLRGRGHRHLHDDDRRESIVARTGRRWRALVGINTRARRQVSRAARGAGVTTREATSGIGRGLAGEAHRATRRGAGVLAVSWGGTPLTVPRASHGVAVRVVERGAIGNRLWIEHHDVREPAFARLPPFAKAEPSGGGVRSDGESRLGFDRPRRARTFPTPLANEPYARGCGGPEESCLWGHAGAIRPERHPRQRNCLRTFASSMASRWSR